MYALFTYYVFQFAAFNNPDLNQIPLTSFLGFGNARSLAKLWGIIANGGSYNNKTLLTPDMVRLLGTPVVAGRSWDGLLDVSVGRGVFFLPTPQVNPWNCKCKCMVNEFEGVSKGLKKDTHVTKLIPIRNQIFKIKLQYELTKFLNIFFHQQLPANTL